MQHKGACAGGDAAQGGCITSSPSARVRPCSHVDSGCGAGDVAGGLVPGAGCAERFRRQQTPLELS